MIKKRPLLPKTETTYSGGWVMPAPHAGLEPAKKLRDKLAGRYDEATGFSYPGRDGINAGPDAGEIYDDTAVTAAPEFGSRMRQGVMPNFSEWASFIAGILVGDSDKKDELEKALQPVNRYLFEMINSSNFTVEADECFLDLGLGTMCIRIDEGAYDNPFNARAIPLRSLLFCIGPDGRPDPIYETRKLAINSLKVHWPDAVLPPELFTRSDPYGEIEVVEAWHRDWSDPAALRYRRTVFLPDLDNRVILTEWHDGIGCCPMIAARWSKASGEGWGRGPLFNVLPSLRKVNFAERALLDHTDIALAGIWTMEDDGVVNTATVRLEPGTLIPVAMGSAGLKNVAPGANFDIAQFVLEEARSAIRKALYTEQLGNPNKTPMSATEVEQRMAELARAVGSPFARLIIEFVMPVIMRCVWILLKRGLIKLPKVDGKQVKLIPTSPLAQGQRMERVDNLAKYGGILGQILGPQALNIVIDGTEFAAELAENMRIPPKVNRPPATQKQILAAIAQSQQQPQGAPSDGQAGPGSPAQ